MNEPMIYEIVLRGHASVRLLARFSDDFVVDNSASGRTRLVGAIRDAAHLHGVVSHLSALAIDLVSIRPVGPDLPQPPNAPERQP